MFKLKHPTKPKQLNLYNKKEEREGGALGKTKAFAFYKKHLINSFFLNYSVNPLITSVIVYF